MEAQLQEIGSHWLGIIGSELIFVPLVGGIIFGLLVSLLPYVQNKSRQSDRECVVYWTNGLSSSLLFIVINLDNLSTALSMLTLVFASSVAIPYIWFKKVWKR